VPAGDIAAALAAGIASAGGRPRSLVLELDSDDIGPAHVQEPSRGPRSVGSPERGPEAAAATAVLERLQVADLLLGSALCIVSVDVVDDATLEDSFVAEIVSSTASLGVPRDPGRPRRARRRVPADARWCTGHHPARTPEALTRTRATHLPRQSRAARAPRPIHLSRT
jgi:hypothetical protein